MPFEDAVFGPVRRYASVFLRLALGAAFLSGVADRFGLWGPAGRRTLRGATSIASPHTPLE